MRDGVALLTKQHESIFLSKRMVYMCIINWFKFSTVSSEGEG